MGVPVSRPSGITIGIYANVNGTPYYFRNLGIQDNSFAPSGTGALEATTDIAGAASFIIETSTMYLYLDDSGSNGYYPIAMSNSATLLYSPIYLNDASLFRGASPGAIGEPLTCFTPVVASTSFGGNIGVLTCSSPLTQSPSTLLSVFGICNGEFVLFGSCADFVTNCNTGASSCYPVSSLNYFLYGSFMTTATTTATTTTSTPRQGISPSTSPARASSAIATLASSHSQGSCSITVMLYIESSTTYVPYGYIGPASPGGISTGNGVGGGSGGGNYYGCTPITSTVGIDGTRQASSRPPAPEGPSTE